MRGNQVRSSKHVVGTARRQPRLSRQDVMHWRKSMQGSGPNARKSLDVMAYKMRCSLIEAYEALTGTGIYAQYPRRYAVERLQHPARNEMDLTTELEKKGERTMQEQFIANQVPQAPNPLKYRHLTVRLHKQHSGKALSVAQVERVLFLTHENPTRSVEEVARLSGVSPATVATILNGTGPYAELRLDPWWQELSYHRWLNCTPAQRHYMAKWYKPPLTAPDAVFDLPTTNGAHDQVSEEAQAQKVAPDDVVQGVADITLAPAELEAQGEKPTQWLFPELEAQPAQAEAHAPTHEQLAQSQAELDEMPEPKVMSTQDVMKDHVQQMVMALGGPEAFGWLPGKLAGVERMIQDVHDMHEWLESIEDELRVLAGWPPRQGL